jgi:hypothetical protein
VSYEISRYLVLEDIENLLSQGNVDAAKEKFAVLERLEKRSIAVKEEGNKLHPGKYPDLPQIEQILKEKKQAVEEQLFQTPEQKATTEQHPVSEETGETGQSPASAKANEQSSASAQETKQPSTPEQGLETEQPATANESVGTNPSMESEQN